LGAHLQTFRLEKLNLEFAANFAADSIRRIATGQSGKWVKFIFIGDLASTSPIFIRTSYALASRPIVANGVSRASSRRNTERWRLSAWRSSMSSYCFPD